MGKYRPSGNVIIGGQAFATDAPIVNFRDPPNWDATKDVCYVTDTDPNPWVPNSEGRMCTAGAAQVPYGLPAGSNYVKRYSTRPALRQSRWNNGLAAPYDAIKGLIRQFVVHHDGCASADMCFSVLQNERGLSCHFLLDNDGTIFQTCDLGISAFHAADHNHFSIGVELCNRGDMFKEPHYYDSGKYGPKREPAPCSINGNKILAFAYTKPQMEAFVRLARALQRLLPNLPAEYPQESPGQQSWKTLDKNVSWNHNGYIGHYHLIPQKWDPGPFDFKDFCRQIRGAFCFPVFTKDDPKKSDEKPLVPQESSELKKASELLYAQNEAKADGGFFPVGPWGEARLWHGGVHMAGMEGNRVFSPFPGRLVAARMGSDSSVGSTNFALLRHSLSLGSRKVEFFSLYMHLADELKSATPVGWVTNKDGGWVKQSAKGGDVVLLDEPIDAGQEIGHVGKAGPGDLSKAQVHVEIFASTDVFENWPHAPWEVVDGTPGGRFSDSPRVNDIIDTNKDAKMSRQELTDFYSGGSGAQTRYLVTLHVSEWTFEPSWSEALRATKDFSGMKPDEIDAMVAEQVTPGLWWDDRVSKHARLPIDGVVYHYHPVSFVAWFNQQLVDAAQQAGNTTISVSQITSKVPDNIVDDFGDKQGTSMRSTSDDEEDPCSKNLSLKDFVEGYDQKVCQ